VGWEKALPTRESGRGSVLASFWTTRTTTSSASFLAAFHPSFLLLLLLSFGCCSFFFLPVDLPPCFFFPPPSFSKFNPSSQKQHKFEGKRKQEEYCPSIDSTGNGFGCTYFRELNDAAVGPSKLKGNGVLPKKNVHVQQILCTVLSRE